MNGFTQFLQLQKVDVAKREVWGTAAVEQPDRAREIMDYEKSLPNFLNWSRDMHKASGGKSHGNVRAMHRDVAAGKVIHLEPRDDTKTIYIGTKIVDDNEWKKVLEGVYTGFSVGGSYGAKWPDPMMKGYTRYEAKPVEISLVDVPCMPGAQFEVIKADGTREMRKLATAGDLVKGDFEGYPFRGNQYTSGQSVSHKGRPARLLADEDPESGDLWIAYEDNPDEDAIVPKSELSDSGVMEHNGIKYAATGKKGTHRATGQSVEEYEDLEDRSPSVWVDEEGVVYNDQGEVENKNKKSKHASFSETASKIQTALIAKEKVKAMDVDRVMTYQGWKVDAVGQDAVTATHKSSNGNVRMHGYKTKNGTWEFQSINPNGDRKSYPNVPSREDVLNEVYKSLGVTDLIKGAGMEPKDLLEKLKASSDPAMQSLAQQLIKAFPPAKKKEEGEEEPDPEGAGDKKKKNPFEAKGDQPQAEDESQEPDGDEGDSPVAESDFDGDEQQGAEAEEQPEAGQPSPEQTEAIRAVVIQLLEELGFVQEQGGQPGAPTAVKIAGVETLRKRMEANSATLAKRLDQFTQRQEEITGDLAKLTVALEEMGKRGGPAPVIRDLGSLTPELVAAEQQTATLRKMIDATNDPTARQALQAELTRLEIKKVQNQTNK